MSIATMPGVHLRVTLTIDIDADDYLEAADHQKLIEGHLLALRADYPAAAFAVRQRRKAPGSEFATSAHGVDDWSARSRRRVDSGRLSDYD